jgi:hypothetical protein
MLFDDFWCMEKCLCTSYSILVMPSWPVSIYILVNCLLRMRGKSKVVNKHSHIY